jgi:cytochrome c oxidase subunit 2
VGRFWSVLFLLVPVLGVASFVAAPFIRHWLPEDISEHGHKIDHLFLFILWLTGAVFVATEAALFWYLWKYDASKNVEAAKFTHGNHSLEIVWTLLPAATLLFIAIYQINAWADAKMRKPDIPPTVEITARQFEWRLRYPYTKQIRADGSVEVDAAGRPVYTYGKDDIFTVNDMHIPLDEPVMVDLKSMDVLHSFFLPNLRVKQDAVPGSKIPVWFRAKKTGTYDLVCAELCGWGHYKMRGRVTVESREDYDRWLKKMSDEQKATK